MSLQSSRRPDAVGPDSAGSEPGRGRLLLEDVTERYRWTALGVVLIGTFMVILDTTIVTVALDPIGKNLHAQAGVEWIVTIYLLAVGIMQPATGWLADRIGRKPVFLGAMGAFAAGSLLCAAAPNLGMLITFRALQGLAGGAMLPVGLALIYELFPAHRRGTALGVWGVAAMAAPAIGPTLGGWLATSNWRLVFLINAPVGAIGVVLGLRLLRNTGYRETRPFDMVGTVLSTLGVVALLLALSEANAWGWASTRIVVLFVIGAAFIGAFIAWALRGTRFPLLDVRVFRIPIFTITIVIICLLTLSQYSRLVFMPLMLESLRHYSPLHAGLVLTPTAVGAGSMMPIGGRLADKIGSRLLVTVGLIVVAFATWMLGHLTPTSSDVHIGLILFVSGLGFGTAMMPNTVAGLNSVPAPLIAQASAGRQLCRQVVGAVAVAGLTAVLEAYLGNHLTYNGSHTVTHVQAGYNAVFLWSFWALIVAVALALFLPGRTRMKELQAERAQEAEALTAPPGALVDPVPGLIEVEATVVPRLRLAD